MTSPLCKVSIPNGPNGTFSDAVKADVAARSAYFCNNPRCNRLLRAPLDQNNTGALKLGQVAHINGNAHTSERHECHTDPSKRSEMLNAIFLCGACHEMIDKRGAVSKASGFSADEIRQWRDDHYKLVQEALTGNYDLFSLARRQSQAAENARGLLEEMDDKRALFASFYMENWDHVATSMTGFRKRLTRIQRDSLKGDPVRPSAADIKKIIHQFLDDLENSNCDDDRVRALNTMRGRLKPSIVELARVSGMAVPQNLHSVL